MPTAKRQKYLDRLAAKNANIRTPTERQAEYDKIMTKFDELGVNIEDYPELIQFKTLLTTWLNTGTAYQGIIRIMALKRDLVYTITNDKRHEIGIMLKSHESLISESKDGKLPPLKK